MTVHEGYVNSSKVTSGSELSEWKRNYLRNMVSRAGLGPVAGIGNT